MNDITCPNCSALRECRERVLTIFIEGGLTLEEKQEQMRRIDMDILQNESALSEVRGEAIDTEALIDFGLYLMKNAAHLWKESTNEQRQRLQMAIFP